MTNIDRANKWYEIITHLTDIEKSADSFERWWLASHYIVFATQMWMMYIDKYLRENS